MNIRIFVFMSMLLLPAIATALNFINTNQVADQMEANQRQHAQDVAAEEQAFRQQMQFEQAQQERRDLLRQNAELRQQVSKNKSVSNEADQSIVLEEQTRQLETDYPVLRQLTAEDLEPLVAIAYHDAVREGKPIKAGVAGTLELRTRVAQIATRLYGQKLPISRQDASRNPGN